MNIFVKGAAALGMMVTVLGATAIPAQAQHRGGHYGYGDRDWRGHRGDHRRWDDRRWRERDRRHWRDGRRHHYSYRQRCWSEWRYDRYRDRNVRVRICR